MSKSSNQGILSHRTFVFESFRVSAQDLYLLMEEILARRAIPRVKISRVFLSEGGLFGAKREYLRVRRGSHAFDISAGAFGESFMVSFWSRRLPSRWGMLLGLAALFFFFFVFSGSGSREAAGCFVTMTLLLLLFGLPFLMLSKIFAVIPGARFIRFALRFALSSMWDGVKLGWRTLRLPTLHQEDSRVLFETTVPAIVEEALRLARDPQGFREAPPPKREILPGF